MTPREPQRANEGTFNGRYVLQELVARGGMGEVFRALVTGADGFEKPVAVKRILPSRSTRADIVEMFVKEAKLMTSLSHPNIVDVLDFGKAEDGSYFLVLEWIEGLDLGKLVSASDGPLPLDLVWAIAREILRGLAYAHGRSTAHGGALVHRDVSPGNVLVSTVGEVKLADFGVASNADAEDTNGLVVGKPGYMAPEQLLGETADPRADLFSAAVVVFHLLTGRSPIRGEGAPERMQATLEGDTLEIDSLRADAPSGLGTFFKKALSVNPESRFQTAKEMSGALDAAMREVAMVASSDAIASAVAAALERASRARPAPIILGKNLATFATRVTMHATGAGFTIAAPEAEPVVAPPKGDEETTPEGTNLAPTSPRRTPLIALAAVLFAGGGALAYWRWARDDSSAYVEANATMMSASNADPSAVRASSASVESAEVSAQAPTDAPTEFAPRPKLSGAPVFASGAMPSGLKSATAAAPACSGSVVFAASHAWVITGGPQRVEAPGRYAWPCGTYGLTATSRLDDAKRGATAVVTEGKTARVDLR